MISKIRLANSHRRALRLKAQIEGLLEKLEAEKSLLVQAGSGKHETEHGEFTVSENNVYDQKVMLSMLTATEVLLCTEPKVVNAKVKVLYPAVYQASKEERGYKIAL